MSRSATRPTTTSGSSWRASRLAPTAPAGSRRSRPAALPHRPPPRPGGIRSATAGLRSVSRPLRGA
eukprot:2041593-Alexandrium_andersonii.AAC.1